MARYTKLITSTKPAALVTAVNTFLNGLVNPTLHRIDINLVDAQSQVGADLTCAIDYSDGGSALATPFQLLLFINPLMPSLESAVNAQYAANPSYFWLGSRYVMWPNQGGRLDQHLAFLPYNATGGASANWSAR